MANEISPAAEFQALPLEFIIAQPLTAAVKAQQVAASATEAFIKSLIDANGKPLTVDFSASVKDEATNTSKQVNVSAPLLSIVPIPHLRIDSLTVDFKYEITQTLKDSSEISKGVDLSAKAGIAWFSATLN